ncbi:hypothetical protein [Phytohabitans suffuscus]|uniref:Uncharacterized protein n=1 Tax=Phytohabitans suffuscus TaxID=624315 RepID=A0A6F8YY95_9ACTN|nr:hypothetical protein [Phytohabitans suffuscus]BCB91117.1 hypothetical protein Psuf_084300 [Phytohabitans suffuscus]
MEYGAFPTAAAGVPTFESAPGHPARAVVDAAGRLVGLSLEARLLRGSPETVARVVVAAVTAAQDAAAAGLPVAGAEAVPPESADAARRELADALAEAELEAERRLSELRVLVADLARDAHGR